jgi:hypothetical protein
MLHSSPVFPLAEGLAATDAAEPTWTPTGEALEGLIGLLCDLAEVRSARVAATAGPATPPAPRNRPAATRRTTCSPIGSH